MNVALALSNSGCYCFRLPECWCSVGFLFCATLNAFFLALCALSGCLELKSMLLNWRLTDCGKQNEAEDAAPEEKKKQAPSIALARPINNNVANNKNLSASKLL